MARSLATFGLLCPVIAMFLWTWIAGDLTAREARNIGD